jgi:glycosyltransferase involved in cell wall biosynthesis
MKHARIVIVTGNPPEMTCGVAHTTARLVEELRRQRPEWEFLWQCRRARWFDSPFSVVGGTKTIRPNHTWDRFGTWLATTTSRAAKPDVLHIQEAIHSYHETGAAATMAQAASCPVVTTLHEFHTELGSVDHTIDLVRNSTAIIANDARAANRCRDRAGKVPDLMGWSPATITPSPTYQRHPVPGFFTTFGIMGDLKLMELVYDAISMLQPARRKLRWCIVGPFNPALNAYHRRLQEKFDPSWVTFTGQMVAGKDDLELEAVFSKTAAMLLPFADGPSTRRTTLQAAWAFGIPVITTPPPDGENAILDDVNCVTARPDSPQIWADAIARVLDSPSLSGRLASEGLRTADDFSSRHLAQLHLDLYDRLIGL